MSSGNFQVLQKSQDAVLNLFRRFDSGRLGADLFMSALEELGLVITESFRTGVRVGTITSKNALFRALLKPNMEKLPNYPAGAPGVKDPNSEDYQSPNVPCNRIPRKVEQEVSVLIEQERTEESETATKRRIVSELLRAFCDEKLSGAQLKLELHKLQLPSPESAPRAGLLTAEQENLINRQEISGRRVYTILLRAFPVLAPAKIDSIPNPVNVVRAFSVSKDSPLKYSTDPDLSNMLAKTNVSHFESPGTSQSFCWNADSDSSATYDPKIDEMRNKVWKESEENYKYQHRKKVDTVFTNFDKNFNPTEVEKTFRPKSIEKPERPKSAVSLIHLFIFFHLDANEKLVSHQELMRQRVKHQDSVFDMDPKSDSYSDTKQWKTVAESTYQHGKNVAPTDTGAGKEMRKQVAPSVKTAPFGTDYNSAPVVLPPKRGEFNSVRLREYYTSLHRPSV